MSPAPVNENQILEALRQTPSERWGEVLAFVSGLQTPQETQLPLSRAAELLKLPLAQREAILAEQAARAAADYASDPELTAFDAFGEDDLHVDSSDSQTR